MKFTPCVRLLLALSYVLNACGSDSEPNDGGGGAGAGGHAVSTGGDGAGGHAVSTGGGDTGGHTTSGGRATSDAGESGDPSDGGAGGGDAGPLSPLVTAFCRAARSCCASTEALGACEHNTSVEFDDAIGLLAGGALEVNGTALLACVAAYQAAGTTCTLGEVNAACHGIFLGALQDGGSCTSVLECDRSRAPKVCLRLNGAATGTCLPAERGSLGSTCAGSCAQGEDCSTTTFAPDTTAPTALCHEEDGLYCPIGESCAPLVSAGDACTWNEACGSDGFCVSTCSPRAQLGASCQFDYGCVDGSVCSAGKCAPEPFATDEVCTGTIPVLD